MKECVIIGGGIVGLCTAFYLNRSGHKVKVIDQSNMDAGASYVNAGYISPSHIIPLSSPGIIKKGLKWMLNPASPFYIRPRLERDFIQWAWAFNKSCNHEHVKRSIPVIKDIAVLSETLYDEIKLIEGFDFHYEKKGLLMLYQTEAMREVEFKTSQQAREVGLDAYDLTAEETQKLEPNVELDIIGATMYRCDAHTTPHEFMANMKAYLLAKGVEIYSNEKVLDIDVKKDRIVGVSTTKRNVEADEFIMAAGSWTGQLSRKLGLRILMQAGKGYRINVERPTGIQYPAILAEAKAAITPMNGFTRFAGTMEIAGINKNINPVRVKAIADAVKRYYKGVEINQEEMDQATSGLRPVSPDGLPYIGRSEKCQNLVFAAGHAMMGWSMATGTGKMVTEIIDGEPLSMDIAPFHPDRRF